MTYSLSKPWRRPRRHSYCFRSLWWLVEREAAWLVLSKYTGATKPPYTRRGFAVAQRYAVRKLAERMIEYRPERRWVP